MNTDKTITTLFRPDPAEYGTTLSLKSNTTNQKNPKILKITFDPKLIFSQHINVPMGRVRFDAADSMPGQLDYCRLLHFYGFQFQ